MDEWQKGDRMTMTPLGYERLVQHSRHPMRRCTTGRFRGYTQKYRTFSHIRILVDGHKCVTTFHSDFWTKLR